MEVPRNHLFKPLIIIGTINLQFDEATNLMHHMGPSAIISSRNNDHFKATTLTSSTLNNSRIINNRLDPLPKAKLLKPRHRRLISTIDSLRIQAPILHLLETTSTLVQEERYRPRTPSPPPIVKLSVRDRKLLWPIGPFIPLNMWGCAPWEMDSTNFVNVLCTNVGVLRLPFSIPFLRLLRSVLEPGHGDHVITFPTMLANRENMAPYWERCFYAQQFLWNNAKYLTPKSYEHLPFSEWPNVEILLGSDNLPDSKWDIYMSQKDDKRLIFRCVEQKLSEDDKNPKATFFVTVHQTGINQVQYSDPTTRDPNIPLPPLDGSPDPRLLPEYQYTLPYYLCLNESRGITTHGFVDIGVPAKRLNFHPFGPRNFDPLWYAMAHIQELVCADDLETLESIGPDQDADKIYGKGTKKEVEERKETMMMRGGPKFLTHDEILALNFKEPAPEPTEK
ncbi:hypothetical protein ABW21_db0200793 [Orbilia brochopaga]|nr:hypothetical protein ABW21_db0200793 [Drechslerella brochopaga]